MNSFRSFVLVLLAIYLSSGHCHAQRNSKRYSEANYLYQQKKYDEVLNYLQSANKLFKSETPEIVFLSAASHYFLNHLEDAEKEFISLLKIKSSLQVESLLFLGQIRFHKQDFTKASNYLKSYLKAIPPSHPNRNEVRNVIRNCATGLALQYRAPLAMVENLGSQLKTSGDEFAPCMNPLHQNRVYFTSAVRSTDNNEPPQTDFYFSTKENGSWQKPKTYNPIFNSSKHEVGLGFNTSGQVLYYFRGNNLLQGGIFSDTIKKSGKFKINPLLTTINPVSAHLPPHFSSDTIIIFPSNMLGGQGGLDLFKIIKRNGTWTKPENLGSSINSAYDENFPFLAPDGVTLYFSSNNPDISIGGYDVFKASLTQLNKAENLGIPINSTADDTHFYAGRDGTTAYFSSNRKSGFGARDIYTAYFFSPLSEMKSRLFSPGIAFKDDFQPDYLEFKPILLNGTEHPLENEYKSYFNTLVPILNENKKLKLLLTGFPHSALTFTDGIQHSLSLLTDIHRFFSRASVNTQQIAYFVHCSRLFEKSNQGISFRFSGELPINMALHTTPLFDGENDNRTKDGIDFKWLIKEITFAEFQKSDLENDGENENVTLEFIPDQNKILIYSGAFTSFSLAQWTNNHKYKIVAFLDGHTLSKERASELVSTYPSLSEYINQ